MHLGINYYITLDSKGIFAFFVGRAINLYPCFCADIKFDYLCIMFPCRLNPNQNIQTHKG